MRAILFLSTIDNVYLVNQANHVNLQYRGGQTPIIHLEADLHASVTWAQSNNRRWVFTLSDVSLLLDAYLGRRLSHSSPKSLN